MPGSESASMHSSAPSRARPRFVLIFMFHPPFLWRANLATFFRDAPGSAWYDRFTTKRKTPPRKGGAAHESKAMHQSLLPPGIQAFGKVPLLREGMRRALSRRNPGITEEAGTVAEWQFLDSSVSRQHSERSVNLQATHPVQVYAKAGAGSLWPTGCRLRPVFLLTEYC